MRSFRTTGWLAALSLLAACQELEPIPERLCGNGVPEPEAGEECDLTDRALCHGPEPAEYACRWVCSAARPCASPGAGCSVDAVCRVPDARYTVSTLEGTANMTVVAAADFTGDGASDLLISGWEAGQASVTFQRKVAGQPVRVALGNEWTVSGDLNCDGREDTVGFAPAYDASELEGAIDGIDALATPELEDASGSSALRVLYADKTGQLAPVSHLVSPPLGGARRLLSADEDGDGRAEPLLLVDKLLFRIPSDGSSRFDQLLSTDARAGLLAGQVLSGNWDASRPCGEIALAERGARTLEVHTLCADVNPTKLATIELPGDATVDARGAFAGDLNGDGREDLIITSVRGDPERDVCCDPTWEPCWSSSEYSEHVYVSYGVGDGTFHERAEVEPGARGNGRTAAAPIMLPSGLLAVADLDGDKRADFVLEDRTWLSGRSFDCKPGDLSCEHEFYWAAAAVSDFNRDGNIDMIGVPVDRRELTFALGLGGGKFNDFSIPLGRALATGADCALTNARALSPTLGVGDFNGDLTNDFAFIEPPTRDLEPATLSVLFGVPLGTPAAPKQVASMAEISDLSAGALFRGRNTLSDLVMLAKGAHGERGEGLGLLAGQTDGALFSPLALPIDPVTKDRVTLSAVALGRFRTEQTGAPPCTTQGARASRQELVLLARNQAGTPLLYFLANSEHGVESTVIEPPTRLPTERGRLLVAMDLDPTSGDGIDEVLIYPSTLQSAEFSYYVARRVAHGFSLSEFTSELRGYPTGKLQMQSPSRLRDIDGDGYRDLVLLEQRLPTDGYDFPDESYAIVFRNVGAGRLEPGTVLHLPLSYDVAPLNIDDDAALELAAATDDGVQLFELPREPATLAPRLKLHEGRTWISIAAGDFNGDGLEDLAAVPGDPGEVQIFWAEERSR